MVLARLGPRQFWEWSSKNSRGKSCLLPLSSCPLASSSSSSSSSSPSARRGIARSRGSPFAFSALAVPWSSSSLPSTAYRVTDVVHLVIRDIPWSSWFSRTRAFGCHQRARIRHLCGWLFPEGRRPLSFSLSFFLFVSLSLSPIFFFVLRRKSATPIENRARGTFATTRGDRLAAPLIIHTRSLASDGGLLIQLTTQNPPGQPSFRHHPACGTGAPLLALRASRYPRIYFFTRELFLVSFPAVC